MFLIQQFSHFICGAVCVQMKMKREIDSIRVDRDMVHARRVNHTDFRGIGHPRCTPSKQSIFMSISWLASALAVPSPTSSVGSSYRLCKSFG